MQVTVQIENMNDTIDQFRALGEDQIPFATMLSITQTAKLAQAGIQAGLPLRFTIRNLSWARSGIRVQVATKQTLMAIVQDIHQYMALQEEGGEKVPQYGQFLAIPLSGARPTPRAVIKKEDLPHAVMASGLGFIRGNVMWRAYFKRSKSRRGFKGVGGFDSGVWNRRIQPMYALVPRANVPARYGFEALVRKVVADDWPQEFEKAFQRAMQTRRPS